MGALLCVVVSFVPATYPEWYEWSTERSVMRPSVRQGKCAASPATSTLEDAFSSWFTTTAGGHRHTHQPHKPS